MPKGGVNDFVLSLLPKLGTMGSNEGEVWVTGLSTLLLCQCDFSFFPGKRFLNRIQKYYTQAHLPPFLSS